MNLENVERILDDCGLELHVFNLSDYDEYVEERFKFNRDENLQAYLVISRPDFFEKCVVPFIQESEHTSVQDPIDASAKKVIRDLFKGSEIIFDYEMYPNRLPKVLMQTAMHVSGAAWFYQKKDCNVDALPEDLQGRNLMGVCLHPKYGGYFSARAVIITTEKLCEVVKKPICVMDDKRDISKLLIEMNKNWQAGLWREVHPVDLTYSDQAKVYFNTIPKLRSSLIDEIRNHGQIVSKQPVVE